jgi:hypothetical protein
MADQNQELATIKKASDKKEVISREEYEYRLKEIAKCKKDIVYFAENYFRIINLDRGLEIIKLYDVQKELLKHLVENNRTIVCSGRQQGKCGYFKSKINLRNKKTGEIEEMTIGDFYEKMRKEKSNAENL